MTAYPTNPTSVGASEGYCRCRDQPHRRGKVIETGVNTSMTTTIAIMMSRRSESLRP